MAELHQTVGTVDYNDIIAAATPTAHVATIKLAASQGVLPRGTVVTGTAGGEVSVIAAAATTEPVYVLCDEVDTGSDAVTAFGYKTGNFVRQRLNVGEYTMTAADWEALRVQGILTQDAAQTIDTEED